MHPRKEEWLGQARVLSPHLPRGHWLPATELEGKCQGSGDQGQGRSCTLWPGRGTRETDL